MSMTMITIFQLIWLLTVYLIITVMLPSWVLGKTVRMQNRYEKFVFYSIVGNFYVINLVYILELLHISYPITLALLTIGPCIMVKVKLEQIPVRSLWDEQWNFIRRIIGGQLKLKAYHANRYMLRRKRRVIRIRHIKKVYFDHFLEVLLILGLLIASFWMFGLTHLEQYGYKASDLVVHNYWVNAMNDNDIFVTGVYPYGYHCMVYYISAVFRIPTFVVLRLLAYVETLWDMLMLLCFLKLLCKTRYLAFLGPYLFALADYVAPHTYSRYAASLPQEYGMMFILPAIYFGFYYFRIERRQQRGLSKGRSRLYLIGFAMSFSLTLTVHFYGTMIAGLYCIGMAIGFARWLFCKRNFTKVVVTVIISVLIAILPMGIAVATGTPLQASLTWGMSVILGKGETETTTGNAQSPSSSETDIQPVIEENVQKSGILGAIRMALADSSIEVDKKHTEPINLVFAMILAMLLCGMICIGRDSKDELYGATLVSTGLFFIFMVLLVSASRLRIPPLMDMNRSSIYLMYLFSILVIMSMDGFCYVLTPEKRLAWMKPLSMVIVMLGLMMLVGGNHIRPRLQVDGMELNGSVECLTKIITDYKRNKWTIVSANDENRMMYGHGYHYELINFLWDMEKVAETGHIRIPTENVFIFIEKVPGDYFQAYEGSGQSVSKEGAEHNLTSNRGLGCYQGKNRWITMSRAYFWSQKFKNLYPNEMTVYYEDDEFVCYKIVQNPYRLFNFAINYGYNVKNYPREEEE